MKEQNSVEFDSFARGYDETFGNKGEGFFRAKVMPYIQRKPQCVLDGGCGSGSVTLQFSEIAHFVVGIDLSMEMIALAKQRLSEMGAGNVDFVVADLENLPFVNRSFDFTFSAYALHHTDTDMSVSELKRVAGENGSILVRDLVVNRPRLHRIPLWHVIYNIIFFPCLVKNKGLRRAMKLTSFELEPSWIRHKANQNLFSPKQFEESFRQNLPGCTFPEGSTGVAFWTASNML
jgi:ubiquinone/menaquinone biosynthesis C-methylase UbiE